MLTVGWGIGLSDVGPIAIEGNSAWALQHLPSAVASITQWVNEDR